MSNKIAILYETHFISNDILRELSKITTASKGIGDAYLLYDDKGIDIPEVVKNYNYYSFNMKGITELNYPLLNDEKRIAEVPRTRDYHHANYQLSVLKFSLDNPGYDYYWYIEYDVRYSGKWNEFFEKFNNDSDLIVSYLRHYDEEPLWHFWYLNHPKLTIPESERIRSFNPVMRISKGALLDLHNSLSDGWVGNMEVLIPTLLNEHGFKLEDFGGSGKFCKVQNINKNYIASPNNINGFLDHGTMRYRPHIVYLGINRNMLYHPVKPIRNRFNYYFDRRKIILKNILKKIS